MYTLTEDKYNFSQSNYELIYDIFESAINVAQSHGIKVIPDELNAAQGDCLFESILDNINHRPEDFLVKLNDGIDTYREVWVTELEERYKETAVYPGFNGKDMTDEELGLWTAAWTQQKNPREYNVDKFSHPKAWAIVSSRIFWSSPPILLIQSKSSWQTALTKMLYRKQMSQWS